MFNTQLGIVIILFFFVWLIILTFFFLRYYLSSLRISRHGKSESIVELLNTVLLHEGENKKALDELHKSFDTLKRDGFYHIQKIGLVRFNPFNDTGGDQSFILALLDAHGTGVVISSLHTRSGTRWYAKRVKSGKGVEYSLSKEEEQAVHDAKVLI